MTTTTPALDFPSICRVNGAYPLHLRALLFMGAAGVSVRHMGSRLEDGEFGAPLLERLPLVLRIHDTLSAQISLGRSHYTIRDEVACIRRFYSFCDTIHAHPTEASAEDFFVQWVDALRTRERIYSLKPMATYATALRVAVVLSDASDTTTRRLLRAARLQEPKDRKTALSREADKQNLTDTSAFGHALVDIASSLSLSAVRGPLPIVLKFRDGHEIEEWCGLRPPEDLKSFAPDAPRDLRRRVKKNRERRSNDTSNRGRSVAINLRIQVELLIFIAQTGINLAEALRTTRGHFQYQSHIDGYLVRNLYKHRKGGIVEFQVYAAYRQHFEGYLHWLDGIFHESSSESLLFPFVARHDVGRQSDKRVRPIMNHLGIKPISPRALRSTRVNWLLRHSDDPHFTAEQAQHTVQTLIRDYHRPHHQRAVTEGSRFWRDTDPHLVSAGPGACAGEIPEPIRLIPPKAPTPDCASPAGCLFCIHHRDLDTLDYVWSIASLRHLKTLELTHALPTTGAPRVSAASLVIERLTAKLSEYYESSSVRRMWVDEAIERIGEDDHHPRWRGFIQAAEAMR